MTNMYANSSDDHARRNLERIAANYNPEAAAEADRIRATVPDHKISPTTRAAMGYADNARKAAEQLKNDDK